MKVAMAVPKISMAPRPTSLTIFSSWRMESSLRSSPERIISTAKKTRL